MHLILVFNTQTALIKIVGHPIDLYYKNCKIFKWVQVLFYDINDFVLSLMYNKNEKLSRDECKI